MPVYGFSEDDAKRIGHAVKVVERSGPTLKTSGVENAAGAAGVRLTIARVGTAFTANATATVTMHKGFPGSVASALTMVGWNQFLQLSTHTAVTNPYVAFGHNGNGWIAVAAQRHTHCSFLGDKYIPYISNYSTTTAHRQVLSFTTDGCPQFIGTSVSVVNGVTLSTTGLLFSFITLSVNGSLSTSTQNITITTCA
jgi:hypothetical protein